MKRRGRKTDIEIYIQNVRHRDKREKEKILREKGVRGGGRVEEKKNTDT